MNSPDLPVRQSPLRIKTGHLLVEKQGFFWGGKDSRWKGIVSHEIIDEVREICKTHNMVHHDTTFTKEFNVYNIMDRAAVMCAELAYAAFGNIGCIYHSKEKNESWITVIDFEGEKLRLFAVKSLSSFAQGDTDPTDFVVQFCLDGEHDGVPSESVKVLQRYLDSVSYFSKIGHHAALLNSLGIKSK